MAIGAGPAYTNAIMGQAPSALDRENARKASSTILREDSIWVEKSENISRPESGETWSMHYDCTDQAPYSTIQESKMMTQNSLLGVPKQNPSHDLAFFLKTTGPTAPHRRPSKIENQRRTVSRRKSALKFLKNRRSRPSPGFRDEGGLLSGGQPPVEAGRPNLPRGVQQKVSLNGKPYLALQIPSMQAPVNTAEGTSKFSPSVLESRLSAQFANGSNAGVESDNWRSYASRSTSMGDGAPTPRTNYASGLERDTEGTVRPVEPSSPPTLLSSTSSSPEPDTLVSIAEMYRYDLSDHPAKHSFDSSRVLSSHSGRGPTTTLPLTGAATTGHPTSQQSKYEMQHPSPRRYASYPLLVQRTSSIASSSYPRSVSDSPGPPPRSPLRLQRDQRTIESIMASENERKTTPKSVTSIKDVNAFNDEANTLRGTVTTDCTGPITRPKSRGKSKTTSFARQSDLREREDRTQARKEKDRPLTSRTIDTVVNAFPATPRSRLKKTRPLIQIPDRRPASLATRADSTASSNASGRKITEYTRTPISAVPSVETPPSSVGEKTGYTPTSATASNGSHILALSPVTLVAEQVPVEKTKSPPRPAKLVVSKDGKAYAPRPRSASISRNVMRARSRSAHNPPRPNTPELGAKREVTPPLPSPPPTRALPPTPPASGSEKHGKTRPLAISVIDKDLPIPPPKDSPPRANTARRADRVPHIATQKRIPGRDASGNTDLSVRLAAVEKQNALLQAALEAVLRTNGELNASVAAEQEQVKAPMAWASRVARRSAAGHAASSSQGSALDMYLYTRQGSRHGR